MNEKAKRAARDYAGEVAMIRAEERAYQARLKAAEARRAPAEAERVERVRAEMRRKREDARRAAIGRVMYVPGHGDVVYNGPKEK